MSRIKQVREVSIDYCDGCGRELGHEMIYGYGGGVILGSCCHRELMAFQYYKLRIRWAIDEIKSQPFY